MTTKTHMVPFKGETITLIEQDGEPFVPIKPICERLGLQWMGQYRKLAADPGRWGIAICAIPSAGGTQETTCIPARKLFGWLMSISPAKVAPEVREALIAYQNESDDVLWAWWAGGKLKALERLEQDHERLTAEFLAAVPMAAKIAALQRAGVERWNVPHRFASRSRSAVMEFVDRMENLQVINMDDWSDERILGPARAAAAVEAAEADAGPTVMERLMGADDA